MTRDSLTTVLLIAAINGAAIGVAFVFFGTGLTAAAGAFCALSWTAVFLFAIDGLNA